MKKLTILVAFVLCACAPTKEVVEIYKGDAGRDGVSCTVANEMNGAAIVGARISCTDGSFSIVMNGQNGATGAQGPQGQQGVQGPVGQTGAAGQACQAYRTSTSHGVYLQCPNQSPVLVADGTNGLNGSNGSNGTNGASCSVSQTSGGAQITCGTSVAFVYNGTNGTNGTNGANGSSCTIAAASGGALITCGSTSQLVRNGQDSALANAIGIKGYIYPCGDEFPNDEIFLRLTDGKILALYDGGPNWDRLALLAPGNYITTDRNGSSNCSVNVSSNLTVTSSPTAATGATQGN